MNIIIVGLGLIGGSIAKEVRKKGFAHRIIGVDQNKQHQKEALQLGLVDEICQLNEAISKSELVILAIPVNAILKLLPQIMALLPKNAVVTDVGSTKKAICDSIKDLPNHSAFVPAHPMAGTENSGPKAAIDDLFKGKVAIICNQARASKNALKKVQQLYEEVLEMKVKYMNADEHDEHVAYVSHISHITSFVLAQTVLEVEKSQSTIFDLASGGFESTVRLAKSSAQMWTPIFLQNKEKILPVIDAYMKNMQAFKEGIEKMGAEELTH
ncbi:prephenate dehydrogenase, partial [Xanthovirga aplysinae]|uniref:prephenate dehydrogenase n=1 Tax=Xanthovirga aplysinae TaxID=2529853 RepID=UPI0012BC6030